MTKYIVQLRVQNGGETNTFTTTDRKYAACFCKSKNTSLAQAGSPNRYFFETVED